MLSLASYDAYNVGLRLSGRKLSGDSDLNLFAYFESPVNCMFLAYITLFFDLERLSFNRNPLDP